MTIPRRNDSLRMTQAEVVLMQAQEALEATGADTLLTEASVFLGHARSKLADFVDKRIVEEERVACAQKRAQAESQGATCSSVAPTEKTCKSVLVSELLAIASARVGEKANGFCSPPETAFYARAALDLANAAKALEGIRVERIIS